MTLVEKSYDALKTVIDPELHIDIVALGLIYDVIVDDQLIDVVMTLTTPGCPLAPMIDRMVNQALEKVAEGRKIKVSLVWDPPWSLDKMSDEARAELGY